MSKTALIVIDMVYDFTNPDGLVYYPQNKAILPKINEAIKAAREGNALVIFMQHRYRKNKPDQNLSIMRPSCIEGTKGVEIDPSLDVKEEDYIIPKRRYSAFFGTDLDLVLREHEITDVVLVGTKTNCCIRSTVHDSYYLSYHTIVIEDCVATNDETVQKVHLSDIDKYYGDVISLKTFKERMCQKQ
jgi:nicotinamidase-related amidase